MDATALVSDKNCRYSETDSEDDDDFLSDLGNALPSAPVRGERLGHGVDYVDADLFAGLLRILVDDTSTENVAKSKRRRAKLDYEELMELTAETEEESPAVAWYYRNLYLMQKADAESEDADLLSSLRNNMGHCKLVCFMLRECLLRRDYRQAAYAVWALASLTRNIHVNRDLFVMVLKATLEIFMVKTADSDGSKMGSRHRHRALEEFLRVLTSFRTVDPREVGIEWLPLLLGAGSYDDATKLQQWIETQRHKQFAGRTPSDPRTPETKRIFTAYTGLACYVYAKRLRKGLDDGDESNNFDDPDKLSRTVKFWEPDYVEEEDEVEEENVSRMDKTRLIDERDKRSLKLAAKAEQLEELAAKSFEESIFHPGVTWDAFVPLYADVLSRRADGGEDAVLEALEKYRETHPNNPNAHRFLFERLASITGDTRASGLRSNEKRKTLLKDSLISYIELAPSDKSVAFRLVDYIRSETSSSLNSLSTSGEEEKTRRSIITILFRLLDYPMWTSDVDCWRRLVDALTNRENSGCADASSQVSGGSGGSCGSSGTGFGLDASRVEDILRNRALLKREWFELRADWWPGMHYGKKAAELDVMSDDFKKLIILKNSFAKVIKRLMKEKAFSDCDGADKVKTRFKAYGQLVEKLLTERT